MTHKDKQQELLLAYINEEYSLSELLSKNFNMSFQDENNENLLHHAIRYNRFDDVETILENNLININKPKRLLETPLHIACNTGNVPLINLLLKFKANPNLQNSHGETPFFNLQPSSNSFFNSELIIEYNINLNIYNNNGITLFNNIIRQGLCNTINSIFENKTLCNSIEWNTTDNNNNNLITSFICSDLHNLNNANEDDNFIKKLIKYGASINHINVEGEKPIVEAIKRHNPHMIKMLHNNGADFSSINIENKTFGAYLNDIIISTDNIIANNQNNSSTIRLKKNITELNIIHDFIKKEKLYTPSINDIKNILKATINSKNIDNVKKHFIEYISTANNKQELLDYCLLQCLDYQEPKLKIANFFIKNGANINSEPIHTNTIPHVSYSKLPTFLHAICYGNKDSLCLINYMIKKNYNLNQDRGNKNYNVLHYLVERAVYKKDNFSMESTLKEILKTSIDINHQSDEGNTPLHILLNQYEIQNRLPLINLYLKQKPMIALKNKKRISIYNKCFSLLNELEILHNPELKNVQQEILITLEQLNLEQKISQPHTPTKNRLKI